MPSIQINVQRPQEDGKTKEPKRSTELVPSPQPASTPAPTSSDRENTAPSRPAAPKRTTKPASSDTKTIRLSTTAFWKDLPGLILDLRLKKPIWEAAEQVASHAEHRPLTFLQANSKGGSVKTGTVATDVATAAVDTEQPTLGIDLDTKQSGDLHTLLGVASTLSFADLLDKSDPLESFRSLIGTSAIGRHPHKGLRNLRVLRFGGITTTTESSGIYEGSIDDDEFDFEAADAQVSYRPEDFEYLDSEESTNEPPKEEILRTLKAAQQLHPVVGIDTGNNIKSRWFRAAVEVSDIVGISVLSYSPSSLKGAHYTLDMARAMYPGISRRCIITVHGHVGFRVTGGASYDRLREKYAREFGLPIGHISLVPYDPFFMKPNQIIDSRNMRPSSYYAALKRLTRMYEISSASIPPAHVGTAEKGIER